MSSNPPSYLYGGTKPEWVDGDFDYDGRVDSDDYGFWSNTMTTPGANYNLGFTPQFGPSLAAGRDCLVRGGGPDGGPRLERSSVPEPGSFVAVRLLLLAWCSIAASGASNA